MDHQQLIIMANKFPAVFDASTRHERGSPLGFCPRQRPMTPVRCALSVVASMAAPEVHSLADVPRPCNAPWDTEVHDNAFSHPLAQARGAACFLASLRDIRRQGTLNVLGCQPGQAVSAWHRMVLQEGRAGAIHEARCQGFPGRFPTGKPAAVELHGPLDGLRDAPLTIVWRPDTAAAPDSLPEPQSLGSEVCLADRGYRDLPSVREVARPGGCCSVRAHEGLPPRVIDAVRADGQRVQSCQARDVPGLITTWPTPQRVALDVEWLLEPQPCRGRLLTRWHTATRSLVSRVTNRPQ